MSHRLRVPARPYAACLAVALAVVAAGVAWAVAGSAHGSALEPPGEAASLTATSLSTRPRPVPDAESLAEYVVSVTGLELVRAVDITSPDSPDGVAEIVLSTTTGPRGLVHIHVFKDERALEVASTAEEPLPGEAGTPAEPTIPGYGVERVAIPGAAWAYRVDGPYRSYCRMCAYLTDATAINISSDAGERVRGQMCTLPFEAAAVERLLTLLVARFSE